MDEISIDKKWCTLIEDLLTNGVPCSPRGLETRRKFNQTLTFDPLNSIILNDYRNLNYRFMMAEAYWILSGDDSVEGIAPWNKNIAKFSDNGKTFFGAYGPKIMSQMTYCADSILKDSDTRQTVINIWRDSPQVTKDVPCTINMVFYKDDYGELSSTVNMRSSDAWLGVPYDVFNFSMVLVYLSSLTGMIPGVVTLNMVNSHLYKQHFSDVFPALHSYNHILNHGACNKLRDELYKNHEVLTQTLKICRDTKNKAECIKLWGEIACE